MASAERTLEQRLQLLEDLESIRRLKARYCERCDDGYEPDGLAELFTADGVWDGGRTFGRREGRDAIRRYFEGSAGRMTVARHHVTNSVIDVDGDTAAGRWMLFQPCIESSVDGAVWLSATYHDTFRRVAGDWYFSSLRIDVAFFTPYEKGWAKQRYLQGREPRTDDQP